MIGTLAFWIILLVGAAWTAWAPVRWREPMLAALAAALIGWADPVTLLVYAGLVAAVWQLVRTGQASRAATFAVGALVVGLVACKWAQAMETGVAGPLGLSYLVFRLIHVLIEARRGQLPPLRSWSEFAHYFLSPALFAAGPLERWEHFSAQRLDKLDGGRAAEALQRIVLGLAKKILVADALLVRVGHALGVDDAAAFTAASSPATLWLGALLSYARIYA
ncbi:MAG: hypothetical protein ABIZ49_13900, partial [Opitutaceae bacterium]